MKIVYIPKVGDNIKIQITPKCNVRHCICNLCPSFLIKRVEEIYFRVREIISPTLICAEPSENWIGKGNFSIFHIQQMKNNEDIT
jgi:hypothetical protein